MKHLTYLFTVLVLSLILCACSIVHSKPVNPPHGTSKPDTRSFDSDRATLSTLQPAILQAQTDYRYSEKDPDDSTKDVVKSRMSKPAQEQYVKAVSSYGQAVDSRNANDLALRLNAGVGFTRKKLHKDVQEALKDFEELQKLRGMRP